MTIFYVRIGQLVVLCDVFLKFSPSKQEGFARDNLDFIICSSFLPCSQLSNRYRFFIVLCFFVPNDNNSSPHPCQVLPEISDGGNARMEGVCDNFRTRYSLYTSLGLRITHY